MLINATQPEELRVALVDGQSLYDLDITSTASGQKKSNIYKCRIARVEHSLEAAFVDYGSEKHGFLPFRNICLEEFSKNSDVGTQKISVRDHIEAGQEFILQVEKEERGNKGAALTNFISLAGRYLVFKPNDPRSGGISRQISGKKREQALDALRDLDMLEGSSVILRTAGLDRPIEELKWDLGYLKQIWKSLQSTALDQAAPCQLYQENEPVTRAIRDYLQKDVAEIWIDESDAYMRALTFMKQFMPDNLDKLMYYSGENTLFNYYQIESQIEAAYSRNIQLPSGGSISIDHVEALIAIDVNSARSKSGGDIEQTALHTNLEAAIEIARQLRIRDLSGLLVIDFIDMMKTYNQRKVESHLRDQLSIDRARIQLGGISRFGLLEMSRQRLSMSLREASHMTCPRCKGHGSIRNNESLALSILRLIEGEACKDQTARVSVELPISVATYLLNEKRKIISEIELGNKVEIVLIPSPVMVTPNYSVERLKISDLLPDSSILPDLEDKVDSESPSKIPGQANVDDASAMLNRTPNETFVPSNVIPVKSLHPLLEQGDPRILQETQATSPSETPISAPQSSDSELASGDDASTTATPPPSPPPISRVKQLFTDFQGNSTEKTDSDEPLARPAISPQQRQGAENTQNARPVSTTPPGLPEGMRSHNQPTRQRTGARRPARRAPNATSPSSEDNTNTNTNTRGRSRRSGTPPQGEGRGQGASRNRDEQQRNISPDSQSQPPPPYPEDERNYQPSPRQNAPQRSRPYPRRRGRRENVKDESVPLHGDGDSLGNELPPAQHHNHNRPARSQRDSQEGGNQGDFGNRDPDSYGNELRQPPSSENSSHPSDNRRGSSSNRRNPRMHHRRNNPRNNG
ncbi:MAG: Rne/Rng family ribonuclease [Candidatus Eutrophobiaceae bacterium]